MTPYPGTIVYEQVKRNGRFLIQDWEDYVFFDQKARYEMGDLTAELMEEMYRKAYRQFYWRPKYIAARDEPQGFLAQLRPQRAHGLAHGRAAQREDRAAPGDGSVGRIRGYFMRVLLASPESEVWTSRKHIPLGLGYLAGVLRESGHQVGIYDAAIEDEPLETVVRRGGYELLGITAVTPLIVDAWAMAKRGQGAGPDHRARRPAPDADARGVDRPRAPGGRLRHPGRGRGEHPRVRGRARRPPRHGDGPRPLLAQERRDRRQPARRPDPEPGQHPLPGARSLQDHALHQPAAAHRRAGHARRGPTPS